MVDDARSGNVGSGDPWSAIHGILEQMERDAQSMNGVLDNLKLLQQQLAGLLDIQNVQRQGLEMVTRSHTETASRISESVLSFSRATGEALVKIDERLRALEARSP
jgi:hypothetical protein